jgi:ectoine hydroxylase-related dioxygenase (phytanoyl-CoA dioxygenase family)
MKSYGINKRNEVLNEEDKYLEEFFNLGYTIIHDVLNETELQQARSELDAFYTSQLTQFGKENLKKIKEENLVRLPLEHSEFYLKIAANQDITKYVEKILGEFYILHLQNGIINMPNEEHHQSSWHRDLPYQNWTSSHPLGCNLFYCLDDFNNETGGTIILPFSHKFNVAPSIEYMEKHSIQVNAKAGSVILFDSMLFHKAGYNQSKNYIRRGINNMYVRPIISQQLDIPSCLNGRYSNDPYLSMLLGYKSQLSISVNDYRNKKLNKLK